MDREELREGEREGAAECVDPSPSPVRGEHLLPAEEFLNRIIRKKNAQVSATATSRGARPAVGQTHRQTDRRVSTHGTEPRHHLD